MDSLRSAPFPLSPEEQLWQASTTGDLRRVIELVHTSPGINVNWQDEQVLRTPFYRACFFGHTRVVRFLLGIPEVSVTRCNSDGTTPFMAACSKGHEEVVRLLLLLLLLLPVVVVEKRTRLRQGDLRDQEERGVVDVNQADRENCTPLWVAAQNGHLPVIRLLLASQVTMIDTVSMPTFNHTSAARRAWIMSTAGRMGYETEVDFEMRRDNCATIADLIEDYDRNPQATRDAIRGDF